MSSVSGAACPPGSYSSGGASACTLCPSGTYGAEYGLTSPACSGACNAGSVCPDGSTSPSPIDCAEGYYCPAVAGGSQVRCPAGSYCPAGSSVPRLCSVGRWSGEGAVTCSACFGGSYGAASNLTTPTCSGVCTAGYVCGNGSTSATAVLCPAGSYCPAGTSAGSQVPCPAGYACAAGSGVAPTAANACPSGSYATNGSATCTPCPTGRYGASTAMTSAACTDVCPGGYYCVPGTTTPMVCGNASVYCPAGSAVPQSVTAGYYSSGGTTASTRVQQAVCTSGSYCVAGVAALCPSGRYSSVVGAAGVDACVVCPAGYFCVAGASIAVPCGGDGVYCPEGSAAPSPVGAGYYSTGPAGARWNRTGCAVGWYCQDGVQLPCPAGRSSQSQIFTFVNAARH